MLEEYNNKVYSKYEEYSDEELIKKIKEGDNKAQTYLLNKFQNVVSMKTKKFFLIGGDNDDMFQEGMIGLYKAIKNFDAEKNNSFKTFANICIERQLITAIKASNRQKHIPLNSSFSLNNVAFEEDDETEVIEILDTKYAEDPLETITKKEYFESFERNVRKSLSPFEMDVLMYYIEGVSYQDIAEKLNSQPKSIDNAIQRIRKKAIKVIMSEE